MQKLDTYQLTPVFISAKSEQTPKQPTLPVTLIATLAVLAFSGVAASIPMITIAAGLITTLIVPAWLIITTTATSSEQQTNSIYN